MGTEPANKTEERLREREALLSLVTETVPVSLLYTDADHRVLFANQMYLNRFNKRLEDVLGKTIREVVGEAIYGKIHSFLDQVLKGEQQDIELHLSHPVLGERDVYARYAPVTEADGTIRGLVCVIHDITEMRRAEAALRASEQELRQANETLERRVAERTGQLSAMLEALEMSLAERRRLSERFVAAQEEERRQISRELHDQAGQHLTGLALGLKALEENIAGGCSGETGAGEILRPLRAIAEELARDLHRIAVELRPTALDDLGLVAALQSHVQRWAESSGIPASFDRFGVRAATEGGAERFNDRLETTVYRVVQEALVNIARHGSDSATRATRVGVSIQRFDGHLLVTVEDNGPGFDVAAARRSGRLGIVGMEERAAACDGTLEIESEPGRGTTVYLRVPLA